MEPYVLGQEIILIAELIEAVIQGAVTLAQEYVFISSSSAGMSCCGNEKESNRQQFEKVL